MIEMGMAEVFAQVEEAVGNMDMKRAEALLFPAMDQFPDLPQCYFHAGNIFFRTNRSALAALCYQKAIELDPSDSILANLGAALRQMNRNEESLQVLNRALEFDPESVAIWTNICACFVNEGNPKPGIEAGERALAKEPTYARAQWNCGLLYLEDGQYEKGWKFYRAGMGKERMLRSYTNDQDAEPEFLTPELYEDMRGQGKSLVVWGEQGIGDELMMGAMLYDVTEEFDVTFECHPRLERIFRKALPDLKIQPTRKQEWITWPMAEGWHCDFKCGMGDLGLLYRKTSKQFRDAWKRKAPFYTVPDLEESSQYRKILEGLAEGRKIIGLATRGGVIRTMRWYRSIGLEDLAPLLSDKRYMFVSFDYEDVNAQCAEINNQFGEGTIYNFPSITQAWDYDHTLALVHATDALVTVCQSVAHLSASSGHPTYVLTPSKPAWRYGVRGSEWYWYPDNHVRLLRQKDDKWAEPVARVLQELQSA